MNNLYIFIDESGNLDFSTKGTKYFVLSAITTDNPIESSKNLQQLKYELLIEGGGGSDLEYFHASEDQQEIRNKVFSVLSNTSSVRVSYIVAEKRKTHPDYHGSAFYKLLGSALAKYLLLKYQQSNYHTIIIIFDQVLHKKELNNFLKEIKPKLKEIKKPYSIYFHKTISDFNAQIADYCAWAKYVSLERGEIRPIEALGAVSKETFDIFRKGDTYYY